VDTSVAALIVVVLPLTQVTVPPDDKLDVGMGFELPPVFPPLHPLIVMVPVMVPFTLVQTIFAPDHA